MATYNDTGILAPVEDSCPQPAGTVSDGWRELALSQQVYINQLLEENKALKAENTLLRMRSGQQCFDIADKVWTLFAHFFDSREELTIRHEIATKQKTWWYLQYDVLSIRSGHIKDFLTFLHDHMNKQHLKPLLTVNNVNARNDLRDFLMKNLQIYTSGQPKKLDPDSLRHPLIQIFPPAKP